jgi:outer membrane immunogenic protein
MRRFGVVVASVSCALACGVAEAADLYPAAQPGPGTIYMPTVFQWSGVYVGGYLGGGFGHAAWHGETTIGSLTFPGVSVPLNGFLGGGQVGVNFQVGAVVFGFESDITGMNVKGSATESAGNQDSTTAQWVGTFSGRVGYTVDRFLAYAKAGFAVGQDVNRETTSAGAVSKGTATRFGVMAGGGLEYAFDKHWSAMVEYDDIAYLSERMTFGPAATLPSQRRVKLNVQRLVGGANYRF